ncbi:helix-turn-helix domain-containing protein [Gordonia alkanivorans]|uniref:helix-turn-helix transcriptional regulator n=1 Tax=Gordonia alkanivorans TaxID=84096 RepID=UPI00244B6D29|nr:helix-turn-helix domain-containing protein [Gordonia alkanivorans]MDH3027027.1 helix-turn-helix domain-containing protein [Gordonia alkanivorans]MDH3050766.1 helix-turn-helix domain-containing protein [Gordonia alkanivorans]
MAQSKPTASVEPVFKNTEEAAALLRLNPGTLRRYRHLGTGPRFFKTPGAVGKVLYRLDDLLAWVEENTK